MTTNGLPRADWSTADGRVKHYLSLGAGVQSSTLGLMAAAGEVEPMPDAAFFADTEAEPAAVYRWLDWLEKQLPFPVYRVGKGSLEAEALVMRTSKKGLTYSRTDIPYFTLSQAGEKGKILHRSCTADYKIKPIMQAARKLAKVKRGEKEVRVIQWIGISLDEMRRMKPSRDPWAQSRWPLIEKRITRQGCIDWMRAKGFPEPPRSACVFCPFHGNAEWRRLQVDEPHEFERAVQFERAAQSAKARSENMESVPYLHRSCKPLDQVDFRSDVEKGQGVLWDDECEGMCGV